MPILKFKCNACEIVFEELVSLSVGECNCIECDSTDTIRHYQGKCYFGASATSTKGSCSGKSCATCSGCSGQ